MNGTEARQGEGTVTANEVLIQHAVMKEGEVVLLLERLMSSFVCDVEKRAAGLTCLVESQWKTSSFFLSIVYIRMNFVTKVRRTGLKIKNIYLFYFLKSSFFIVRRKLASGKEKTIQYVTAVAYFEPRLDQYCLMPVHLAG